MGAIQNTVNNTITAGAALTYLSPDAKDRTELRDINKQQKSLEKQTETYEKKFAEEGKNFTEAVNKLANGEPMTEEIINAIKEGKVSAKAASEIVSKKEALAKRKSELQPTAENVDAYLTEVRKGESNRQVEADRNDYLNQVLARNKTKMQQANMRTAQQGEVKKQQMDDFNKRILLALKTSLGSTVGELPENIQKQVLEAYKKEENK